MKLKLVYIISQVSHSKLFEWTAALLSKEKYELSFILLHKSDTPFETHLRNAGFNVHRVWYNSKTDLPSCVRKIRSILRKEKAQIVHTHLFEGGLAGSLGAKLAGVRRRIHTRHDAMIHHDFYPSAVKYDRLTNKMSTDIIAITNSVADILNKLEGVVPEKIRIIHHGFRLTEYAQVPSERIEAVRRKYFSGRPAGPVIGVVSRFIEWKGIQFIIPAFLSVLERYPDAHLLLCNAQGPYKDELIKLLNTLPASSYTCVPFETDMAALYKLMDVFVHVPVDEKAEAFGQVYIEAMAAGIASVVTLSGIAPDYITDNENALVVPFRNSESITLRILQLFGDDTLRKRIAEAGYVSIQTGFTIERMIKELEACYDA